ncbi:diguanylate cyclase [Roseomonas sp. SSH11]|uniref:diguanylate cyclase n=1 Tax=Pararoseomonas baculiformis TaxID=2820812 RepID=A0ABS4AKC6_9PROT|nr:diguanylate cyclase [Pararoseomonas baculiformis]MBP0447477.1 diguanylate cyclase [Pararoseomonas baculiformis]
MVVLALVLLADDRRAAKHERMRAVEELVSALEREVARPVGLIDLSLQGIAATTQLAQPGQVGIAPQPLALFNEGAAVGLLDSLLVVDAGGKVVASSAPLPDDPPNLTDRDYFQMQQGRHDLGPYMSQPFRSRPWDDARKVALSRRLASPDGDFRGVAIAELRLDHFERVLSQSDFGRHSTASLLRRDSEFALHYLAGSDDPMGGQVGSVGVPWLAHSSRSGQIVSTSLATAVERLYTYRQVGNLPLVVVAATSFEDIDAIWRRRLQVLGSIVLVLCSFATVHQVFLRGAVFRRGTREASLVGTTEQQDGLSIDISPESTERARFDALLDEAWQHAAVELAPLSLLIVSIDFMHAFNTQHGRPAGAEVVSRIDACIERGILPGSDVRTHLGGGEFGLLLPRTDSDGAATLAELLRASVDGLCIEHAASPKARVTVSIGWSSCVPGREQAPDLLLARAELAVSMASREGHNCVVGVVAGDGDPLQAAA